MPAMPDIFAGLTSSFANDLLGSHQYPLLLHIEEKNFLEADNSSDIEIDASEPEHVGQLSEFDIDENSEDLVQVTVESFVIALGNLNGSKGRGDQDEIEKELIDLFAEPIGDEEIDLPSGQSKRIMDLTDEDIKSFEDDESALRGWSIRKLWDKIKKAIKKVADIFVKKFKEFLKKYFRFTIKWTEFNILSRPEAVAGDPIELKKIDLKVRIKLEACIKIYKWRCADVTSPWVHLKAGRILYDLDPVGLKVFGKPRVDDMRLVITINIFGYKFDVEIGITGFVNKQLDKQKPDKLWDAEVLKIEIETLNRKFVAGTIGVRSAQDSFVMDVDGKFQPI